MVIGLGGQALAGSQRGAAATYTDPAGDSGSAPDITQAVVSHLGGEISFRVVMPGVTALPADVTVYVGIDFDQSRSTGSPTSQGADFVLITRNDDHSVWIQRWNGSSFDPWQPTGRPFTSGNGVAFSINNSWLGGTTAFRFWISAFRQTSAGGVHADYAPDFGTWTYTFAEAAPAPPPPPPAPPATTSPTSAPKPAPKPRPTPVRSIRSVKVETRPALPTAGAAFSVVVRVIVWNTGATQKPASVLCAANLAGKPLKGTGAGGCTFRLPRTSAGKKLAVRVTARCRGKAKSTTIVHTVRAAPKPVPPKPKPKPPPTTTTTPATTPGTIATPAGRLAITGADVLDRFPPGCVQGSPFCDVAAPGYQILVVWLKVVSGNPEALVNQLRDAKVVVVASDGSRTAPYSGGLLNGRLFLAFTPRKTSHGFKLVWPGNPPIPLGK